MDIHIPADPKTNGSGEWYTICPICTPGRQKEHRKELKFAVNLHKVGRPWRCNHCNESGYVVDEAYLERAKIKPIVKNYDFLPMSEKLVKWFQDKRGISKKTLDTLDICSSQEAILQTKKIEGEEALHGQYVQRECINFKYKKDGILINVKYRDKNKNFKMIAEATKILYNIDSIKGSKEALIVEGEIDVAAYIECGYKPVVSVPNGVSITDAEKEEYLKTGQFRQNLNMEYLDICIDDFKGCETIYLGTDDDIAGKKLREELARRLGKNRCKYIKYSSYKKLDGTPCKDGNEVLISLGPRTLRETINNAYSYPISGVTTAMMYWDKMESVFDNGRQKGFSTGYRSIDPHFNWMPGWLTLANGFPGEGKSSNLFNFILITTVLYNWKWGMYCPENYPVQNVVDTLCEILVGDTADISFGDRMSKDRYKHAVESHIETHFFFVDNEDGYTPSALREIKKSLVRQHGINGFFTDPWKNLYHDMGNMTIDMYLQRELAAEVRIAQKNDLINLISHHPPTPPRTTDKNYPAPSYFELIGGQIWSASSYAMLCFHKHDRVSWKDTIAEMHVQKIKEHKLAGIPTDRNNPILLNFNRRSGRLYERADITDMNSPYTAFPFGDYSKQVQSIFEGF